MRAIIVAMLIIAADAAAADEPGSPIVSQTPIPRASPIVPPPTAAEADDLARSGRTRLATGIALIAIGVVGWGASTAGTVLSIVGYVKDARHECSNGACDTIQTTGRWLGIGGTIAEVGGLAGGIPLLVSGIRRIREARRMRVGVVLTPTGGALGVGGSL